MSVPVQESGRGTHGLLLSSGLQDLYFLLP